MNTWAWRAFVTPGDAEQALVDVLAARGLVPTRARDASVFVSLHADGEGGSLVRSRAPGGAAVAVALCRRLGVAARYAEIDLREREVFAGSREIGADGSIAKEHDESSTATEICEDWHEGERYRPESADELAAVVVGLDQSPETEGRALAFALAPGESARVRGLLDAVAAGARWERTSVGGRPAIRVIDASGTRISVLDAAELDRFERGVSA